MLGLRRGNKMYSSVPCSHPEDYALRCQFSYYTGYICDYEDNAKDDTMIYDKEK